jgi:hypothetical protein
VGEGVVAVLPTLKGVLSGSDQRDMNGVLFLYVSR